jgi:hypothetical protein
LSENTTSYKDALQILLTSDAPPAEDEEAWSLIHDLSDHLRALCLKWFNDNLDQKMAKWKESAREAHRVPLPCLVDSTPEEKKPCEVLAPLWDRLGPFWTRYASRRVEQMMVDHLPCSWCRQAERCASKLPGTRLGQNERKMLLDAAPASGHHVDGGTRILPDDPSPSLKVMMIRARQKLYTAGLIWKQYSTGRPIPVERTSRFQDSEGIRHVQRYEMRDGCYQESRLSPFGAAIVSRYRLELEENKPVRWDERVAAALAEARKETTELVSIFAQNLSRYLCKYDRFVDEVTSNDPPCLWDEMQLCGFGLEAIRETFPEVFSALVSSLPEKVQAAICYVIEKLPREEQSEN